MGTYTSRWQGRAQELAGMAKEKLGQLTGQSGLRAEGSLERTEGEARRDTSKLLRRARSAADKLIGSAKVGFGRATGKKRYVIEGKQQRLKGQLEHTAR